jgi:hypothetical protein
MKYVNGMMYDTFMWNWLKSILCGDLIFIISYINDVIANEIHWPTLEERIALSS